MWNAFVQWWVDRFNDTEEAALFTVDWLDGKH